MIDKKEIDAIRDLVDITFSDMSMMTFCPKRNAVIINCYFLEAGKEVVLPIAELMLYKDSAKGFINYLKEKITEELGRK